MSDAMEGTRNGATTGATETVVGRLVLDDRMASGRIAIEDGLITAVEIDEDAATAGHLVAPGFVDVHVHGWGGHDAMGDGAALEGMARALLRQGVTSFLPTAVTAPLEQLVAFADRVRAWLPDAPTDGAEPLGFNLEGPFLAEGRRGAHDPAHLRVPEDVTSAELEPLIDGLRLLTVAPELAGAIELIAMLAARGVAVSVGHSAATFEQARAAYEAGATSTTHLFNAMTGIDHHAPGLAAAALLDDSVYVELITDGIHVDRVIWPVITRL
jgi:N-acetylglucosamine-6-phosphate deacetylase